MEHITIKLTVEELKLLTALASDQLFRREFIDPKMPGRWAEPEELNLGKALVGRLRSLMGDGTRASGPAPQSGNHSGNGPKRNNRVPDAV